MRHRSNVLLSLVAITVILTSLNSRAEQSLSDIVDADGAIAFPEKFRTTMVHLGSWFVPAGGASGFHDVYTEAASVDYFRKHGSFPDGATLVKELRASKSGTYTTGEGVHHATDVLKQWFVMVKDSENRYASNGIWGDGWGWALFKPDNPTKNLATDYKVDCLGCHVPAQKNDWIYTEAYPILSE
jgi:hypothetical protein